MISIGTDIIKVSRIDTLIKNKGDKFLNKVFTISFSILYLSKLILYYPSVTVKLGACSLQLPFSFFIPITSALPDQGPQLRWQNSTDKEGCQRHALWSVVFYLFLLIPDHTANVAQGSSQEISPCAIRDQFWSLVG